MIARLRSFNGMMGVAICLTIVSLYVFLMGPVNITYNEAVLLGAKEALAQRFYLDKVFHLVVFFILTYHYLQLVVMADVPQPIARVRLVYRLLGIGFLMLVGGAGIEWMQSLVAYREATWGDFLSNITGIVLAFGFFLRRYLRWTSVAER